MIFTVKYCNIITTFRKEKASLFLRAERSVMILNANDLILHFVDKYIEEKEKNFFLHQQLEQQQQQLQNDKVKTN